MAQFANMFVVDLNNRSYPVALNQTVSEGNVNSNRIGAYVYKDGQPYNLGGACTGLVMRADGTTVPMTGVIDGNAAYVVLNQESCAIPGPIQVAVSWVSGNNTTTLLVAYGTVITTDTRSYVQSGPIADVNTLLGYIGEVEQAAADAAESAASAAESAETAQNKCVRFDTDQSLTTTQKTTARGNIDAAGLAQVVRYDADQSLTTTQKSTARGNIDAAGLAQVVRHDASQNLTETQKNTARGNIDAANVAEVKDLKSAFNYETYTACSPFENGHMLLSKGLFDINAFVPNGGYVNEYPYRISSRRAISFPFYATLVIADGFRLYPYFQSGSSWAGDGWKTGEFNISANTPFYCQIARVNEVSSEVADVPTFLNAVTVKGGYSDIRDTETYSISQALTYSFRNWEVGGWNAAQGSVPEKEPLTGYRIRSRNLIRAPRHVMVNIKQVGVRVVTFYADSNGNYLGSNADDRNVGYYDHYLVNNPNAKYIFLSVIFSGSGIPTALDDYFTIEFRNNSAFADGKNVFVYRFGGSGNDWCFVRTPAGYDSMRNKPYPFVICNHGNGWVMDGSIKKANWTKRTMYVPLDDPDYIANPTQYNGTSDETLWYSNPTIEALLSAGYVVCGCENYADELYGNNNCRNACVEFFHHMVKTYNVENRCYMIGASNGAMTSLNAAYVLQGAVKAMILQYPLTCLVNQYFSNTSQQAEIKTAYSIPVADVGSDDTPENRAKLTKYVATHDPLTVDVASGMKIGSFPPVKMYYSADDTVTRASVNALVLYDLLETSNKVTEKVECSGGHGDQSHFAPADYVAFFNAN